MTQHKQKGQSVPLVIFYSKYKFKMYLGYIRLNKNVIKLTMICYNFFCIYYEL